MAEMASRHRGDPQPLAPQPVHPQGLHKFRCMQTFRSMQRICNGHSSVPRLVSVLLTLGTYGDCCLSYRGQVPYCDQLEP